MAIKKPEIFNFISQVSSSVILKGPDPIEIPGSPTMITEIFKLSFYIIQHSDEILNALERKNNILNVEPIPLNPADNTNFQRPYIPELKLRTNTPSVNQLPEPPVLKPKN